MKRLKLIAAASSLTLLMFFACRKEGSTDTSLPKMVADKSQVKPGETVSFSIQNGLAGALAKWTVTPNTNVQISRAVSWDQRNTITFNEPGNYTVNVQLKKVWCDSAAAANPGMDTCLNSGKDAGSAHATILVKN
jgi:hypothetical protein